MKCQICGEGFVYRWTDTHGVGACHNCGAPYTIYHYGDDNKRIDKPPEICIKEEWIPLIKRYWEESKRNCAPGFGNIPGSSYEIATPEDFDSIDRWMKAHEHEFPETTS